MDFSDIKQQLDAITRRVENLEQHFNLSLTPVAEQPPPFAAQLSPSPPPSSFFKHWIFSHIWTLVGILFILLSAGWLANYLYSFHLLTPQRMIISGLILFLACYCYGIYLRPHQSLYAQGFLILGSSGLALLLLLEHLFFHQFPLAFQMTGLFLDISLTLALGVYYQSQSLATSALGFAILIPFIIQTPFNKSLFFLFYILFLSSHAFLLLFLKEWRSPLLLAWIGTFFYSLSFLSLPVPHIPLLANGTALFFPLLFFSLYSLVFVCFSLKRKGEKKREGFLFILTNLIFIEWIQLFSPLFKWQLFSFATLLTGIMGGVLFYYREKSKKESSFTIITAFFFFMFLAEATSSLPWLMRCMLYFLQGLGAVSVALTSLRSPLLTRYVSFYFFIPLITLFSYPSVYLDRYAFFEVTGLILVALGALMSAACLIRRFKEETLNLTFSFYVLATILLFIFFLWIVSWNLFLIPYQARSLALVLTTLVSTLLIFQGGGSSSFYFLNRLGSCLLTLVITWLLIVETAEMSTLIRILTFFVVGVILLATVNRKHIIYCLKD